MVFVSIRPLSLVKTLLLLFALFWLVILIILRTHEALRVFLMNCCNHLPTYLMFRGFRNRMVFELVGCAVVFNLVASSLDVGIVYSSHTIIIRLIVVNGHHHSILHGLLVSRCRPRVCHSPLLRLR